jgi:DNA-binding NtrC family response regulator
VSLERRTIALIEDDPIMGESLAQRLRLEGAAVRWWKNGAEALSDCAGKMFDAVVCDIRLPDMSGEAVFRQLSTERNAPRFLFITGYGDIDQAVRLMREGASDYMTKPFVMDDFLGRLGGLMGPAPDPSDEGALGVSSAIREAEQLLRRVAPRTSTVLITGETGAGKDVAARLLHSLSPACRHPFIAVNCAAIPSDLLESELFGHEKGAFTGASSRHLGYAERAGPGILFLDEISDLPLPLQGKLLQLLEDRVFFRVGGEQPVSFKARVVAATNRDLSAAVSHGQFREDLYYRINVISVRMPPLRERRDDIPWLLEHFLAEFTADGTCSIHGISPMAIERALSHPWPGNVRELRNRLERAAMMASGDLIMPGDLFPSAPSPEGFHRSLGEVRESVERREIERVLGDTGWNVSEAARLLRVSRTTLWEKMRRLQIKGPRALHS